MESSPSHNSPTRSGRAAGQNGCATRGRSITTRSRRWRFGKRKSTSSAARNSRSKARLSIWMSKGLPDRDFYYLIGLRIGNGKSAVQHSLWADTVEDERKIWREFLGILETIEKPVLIH